MNYWINIILIMAIAVGIWITSLIVCLMISKQNVSKWHFIIMAIAWTTVISHYLGLWG